MIEDQKQSLVELIGRAAAALGAQGTSVRLERPKSAEHGDLATNVAMQLARTLKKNPRQIAEELVAAMKADAAFGALLSDIEIAGPGFINMRFNQAAKFSVVRDVLEKTESFGSSSEFAGKSVLLEYVSANPTGPLHLGHARQGALGDVLSRVMHTQGYKVLREFYYNDAGVQIHNLTISVQARAKEMLGLQGPEAFPEKGYQGLYINDIARDYLDKKPVTTTAGEVIAPSGDSTTIFVVVEPESTPMYASCTPALSSARGTPFPPSPESQLR